MKRILTFFLCLVGITLTSFADSTAKCLLQHKGTCTYYDSSAIVTAISKAVDGDTIFLTEGRFPGFTVNKKITVRGTGENTKVGGDVNISISGTPTLTQTILEGVYLYDNVVSLTTSMTGVTIKQCYMKEFNVNVNNKSIVLDRCYINGYFDYSTYIKDMTVINSYLQTGSPFSTNYQDWPVTFVNCYIYSLYINSVRGNFINCILYGSSSANGTSPYTYCDFTNCLLTGNYTNINENTCIAKNCYENKTCETDANTLEEYGYLGNDGTIVGEYGGLTPYSLELNVPKVRESNISLDMQNKVLNVSLKVTAE